MVKRTRVNCNRSNTLSRRSSTRQSCTQKNIFNKKSERNLATIWRTNTLTKRIDCSVKSCRIWTRKHCFLNARGKLNNVMSDSKLSKEIGRRNRQELRSSSRKSLYKVNPRRPDKRDSRNSSQRSMTETRTVRAAQSRTRMMAATTNTKSISRMSLNARIGG